MSKGWRNMMSKGSRQRPLDRDTFNKEYDRLYGTKVEACDFCDTEVRHLGPEGLAFCTECDHMVEGNTHLRNEDD